MGKKERWVGDKDLPEAELIEILLRLPVVSLLRFKSVSKSWCALIQTSSFIDLYFKSSSSSNTFGSFILQAAVDCERFRENALLMLSSSSVPESFGFNSICAPCVTDYKIGAGTWWRKANDDQVYEDDQQQQLVLKLDNLGFPSCYNFGTIRPMVVGSCNGLICLHDSERNDVSLWNPATRQFRILPKSITFHGDCLHHRLFAFGFDAKTKDYKVVLLSGFRLRPRIIDGGLSVGPMECLCRVQVYSLSTDSWRLLEGINLLPGLPFSYPPEPVSGHGQGQLLYLNGSCFFMAKFLYSEEEEHCILPPKDNDRFIISIDLTKEIITPIRLSYHLGSEKLYLCYFDDKLALFTATNRYLRTDCWELFNMLVLNEHCSSGRRNYYESWTELHSFKIKHDLPGEEWIIPRGISNDGVFVFLETRIHGLDKKKKMKLYNSVT